MKNKFLVATILIVVIAVLTGFIGEVKNSKPESKHNVLIHLATNIKKDDGPPCVAFDIALVNSKLGKKVEFLFDSEAAWNLKRTEKDGKNDFDRYEVPKDLKELLVKQLKDSELLELKNFGDFLELLSKRGVKITVNGTWNVLTGVEKKVSGKTKLPSYVNPLYLQELASHINGSDVYYRY
ncbi:MAG: hypothetical protein HYZ10_06405 [Ignavibacteriales bacterium]|nr:hypothetical protein [Ignavibacteriales bacterium]